MEIAQNKFETQVQESLERTLAANATTANANAKLTEGNCLNAFMESLNKQRQTLVETQIKEGNKGVDMIKAAQGQ